MSSINRAAAILALLIFNMSAVFAAHSITTGKWMSSNQVIGEKKAKSQLKSESALPVIFPAKIPMTTQKLYAAYSSYGVHSDYNHFWQLNVDATPTCQGAKFCNVGYISAEKDGKLELYYFTLPDNQSHLKERVSLQNKVVAYYTPSHTQATSVDPTLEWQVNHVLYTLSWRIPANSAQQKRVLIEMANSTYTGR